MKTRFKIFVALMLCLAAASCSNPKKEPSSPVDLSFHGKLNTPIESSIKLDSLVINQFDEARAEILKRYFASNPRWEIRRDKRYRGTKPIELIYAIRKEKRDGSYETTLNGFYSNFGEEKTVLQTRVIVSFGAYYGFGNDTTNITYAEVGQKRIQTIIESEHAGTPGNSSYIVLKGNSINLEVYEQSKQLERLFTVQTIKEINDELKMVLENLYAIEESGKSPDNSFYPERRDSSYFEIADGMQPGIYVVKAGLLTKEKGSVYVKVFDSKMNGQLSAERMTPRTTREIGWSKEGKTIFEYESDLTVYEGDWEHEYQARFEIWFRAENGEETKLAQKERMIYGWEF